MLRSCSNFTGIFVLPLCALPELHAEVTCLSQCAMDNAFALLMDASGWSVDQMRESDPDIQLAWTAIINWPDAWTIRTLLRTNPQKQYPHRKPNDKPIQQLSNLSSKRNAVHAYFYYSNEINGCHMQIQRGGSVFSRTQCSLDN